MCYNDKDVSIFKLGVYGLIKNLAIKITEIVDENTTDTTKSILQKSLKNYKTSESLKKKREYYGFR